jgi:hypothetical protein
MHTQTTLMLMLNMYEFRYPDHIPTLKLSLLRFALWDFVCRHILDYKEQMQMISHSFAKHFPSRSVVGNHDDFVDVLDAQFSLVADQQMGDRSADWRC